MKKAFFAICMAVSVFFMTACGSVSADQIANATNTAVNTANTAATVANTASSLLGASSTDAMSNGKTAGAALKTLLASYLSNGKLSLSGTNLLTATSLVAACKDLKSYKKGDNNYSSFAKGLVQGSLGLVTENTAATVVDDLVQLSGVDTQAVSSSASTITNSLSSIATAVKAVK